MKAMIRIMFVVVGCSWRGIFHQHTILSAGRLGVGATDETCLTFRMPLLQGASGISEEEIGARHQSASTVLTTKRQG